MGGTLFWTSLSLTWEGAMTYGSCGIVVFDRDVEWMPCAIPIEIFLGIGRVN